MSMLKSECCNLNWNTIPIQTAILLKKSQEKTSSAILDEVESCVSFWGGVGSKWQDKYLKSWLPFSYIFTCNGLQGHLNTCTIQKTHFFLKNQHYKSITVVLWHIKCSVACPLPTCLNFNYPTLWHQNTSLLHPGQASKHWTHWQTRCLPPPDGSLCPAGRSTCYSSCCSSAWCCPSSSASQTCCSVWCSRGRHTGWAGCC